MGLLSFMGDVAGSVVDAVVPEEVQEVVADVGGAVVDAVVPEPIQEAASDLIDVDVDADTAGGGRSWVEDIGTLAGDGFGLADDLLGKKSPGSFPLLAGIGDLLSGGAKLTEDEDGERNWGGLGDLANGVMGIGGKLLGASDATNDTLGQVGGFLDLVTNGYEAYENLDKMSEGSYSESKDCWGALGDAGIGGLKMIPGAGKVVGAAETVLDTAGFVAGQIDEDYKFGAGDALGYGMYNDHMQTKDDGLLESAANAAGHFALGGTGGIPGSKAVVAEGIDLFKGLFS